MSIEHVRPNDANAEEEEEVPSMKKGHDIYLGWVPDDAATTYTYVPQL